VKNTKRTKKEIVNDRILVKKNCVRICSGNCPQALLHHSSIFHFFRVSIRALYQKLWSFEVFLS